MSEDEDARRARVSVALVTIFLVVVFLSGGDSRADGITQIFARDAAVVFGALAIVRLRAGELRRYAIPLGLVLTAIALVLIQLVPLPPSWWRHLSGHASLADAQVSLGAIEPARPISLTPDLTLNAAVALLPPLALILLMAAVDRVRQSYIAAVLLGLILLSAIIGILQAVGSVPSFYASRFEGFAGPAGLFANRNHQGALLALALPLCAVVSRKLLPNKPGLLNAQMLVVALLVWPAALATGSRAALILGLLGAACGLLIGRSATARAAASARELVRDRYWKWSALIPLLGLGIIGAVTYGARTEAFSRLFKEDVAQEIRYHLFRPMVELGWSYFPFGSGYGSFAEVYKSRERVSDLSLSYFNQAHNDLLQLFIEGGALALLAALLALAWSSWSAISAWMPKNRGGETTFVRLGSVIVAILVLASLGDYPLRTPTLAVVLALAACWLVPATSDRRARAGERAGPVKALR